MCYIIKVIIIIIIIITEKHVFFFYIPFELSKQELMLPTAWLFEWSAIQIIMSHDFHQGKEERTSFPNDPDLTSLNDAIIMTVLSTQQSTNRCCK